ncbi:hypothetical protein AGMMS50268_25560 [Spirochaetia bacterium]|nr:hypothetical protein AGMMS50268_25560 [Spirochaetia bacterium]
MPLLQVRDCPEDIYEKINMFAKKEHRTIAQQTIVLLEKAFGQEESNKERVRRILEEIKNTEVPEAAKAVDYVKLIREDRNR